MASVVKCIKSNVEDLCLCYEHWSYSEVLGWYNLVLGTGTSVLYKTNTSKALKIYPFIKLTTINTKTFEIGLCGSDGGGGVYLSKNSNVKL